MKEKKEDLFLLYDEENKPLRILLEYTLEDLFCPSCFRDFKKKYKMKRIKDVFGKEAYSCKHCNYPIGKDRLIEKLDKLME